MSTPPETAPSQRTAGVARQGIRPARITEVSKLSEPTRAPRRGQRPEAWDARLRKTKKSPNPMPAATASATTRRSMRVEDPPPRLIAPTASRPAPTPSQARTAGRSPSRTPASTGSAALTTAVTGAAAAIAPLASARKNTTAPAQPQTPDAAPHARLAGSTGARSTSTTGSTTTRPARCAASVTSRALARRLARPPRKSAVPKAAADASASTRPSTRSSIPSLAPPPPSGRGPAPDQPESHAEREQGPAAPAAVQQSVLIRGIVEHLRRQECGQALTRAETPPVGDGRRRPDAGERQAETHAGGPIRDRGRGEGEAVVPRQLARDPVEAGSLAAQEGGLGARVAGASGREGAHAAAVPVPDLAGRLVDEPPAGSVQAPAQLDVLAPPQALVEAAGGLEVGP